MGLPEFLTTEEAAHTVALLGHRQLQHLWGQVRGTVWLLCLPHPAHCYTNPARSSRKAVIRRHHPSSLPPGAEPPLHFCQDVNSCLCPRALFWEVSLSSGCQGGTLQRHQCYVSVYGPFEMSHPKVTSKAYFLHLSALWETLFSPEI